MARRGHRFALRSLAFAAPFMADLAAAHTDAVGTRFLSYCAESFPEGWASKLDDCKRSFVARHEAACQAEKLTLVGDWDDCVLGDTGKRDGACALASERHVAVIDCQIVNDLRKKVQVP